MTLDGTGELIVARDLDIIPFPGDIQTAVAAVRIGGVLNAGGTFSPGLVEFFGAGGVQDIPDGTYQNLLVTGDSVEVLGIVDVSSNVTVSGLLHVMGTMNVGAGFGTTGAGALRMDPGSVLDVVDAAFGGGSTAGRLTGGTLRVSGGFAQTGDAASFQAGGTHLTVLVASDQAVTFTNPDTLGTGSSFQDLELEAGTGSIILMSGVFANGALIANPVATPVTVLSSGMQLTARALNVTGLTLGHVLLQLITSSEALPTLDNVTFQSFLDDGEDYLLIRHAGNAAPMSFTGLAFTPAITTPGTSHYINVTNTTLIGLPLTINVSTNPGNGPAKTIVSGAFTPVVN
jgi:hypothetical protein